MPNPHLCEPDFSRVLKTVMRTGLPDRIPIMEFFASGEFKVETMKADVYTPELDVKFWQLMGLDYVPLYLYWGMALRSAREMRGISSQTQFNAQEQNQGLIRDMNDIEAMGWPTATMQDWAFFDQIGKYLPDGMKMIAAGGYIFAEAWMLMGFDEFCYALYERPEVPEAIMQRLGEFRYQTVLQVIDHPNLGAFWFDDDIAYQTGTMVPPDFLRKNLFPWMRKIADLCKSRGIPFIYHSDGNLKQVIPDLIDLGVNAIQPVEPLAMDAVEIKKEFGGRLSLIGNVELDTLVRGSKPEIEKLVIETIGKLGPGGGYGLGSSNTIPAWASLENYLHFRDCCVKYGQYPLSV